VTRLTDRIRASRAIDRLSPATQGGLLMLVVAGCNALDTALTRIVTAELHPFEVAFFRNLFSLVVVLPWLVRAGAGVLRSDRLGHHVVRAALKLAAMVLLFTAISRMPLGDVTAIVFTSPLFVTLGAALFLGEMLTGRRGVAVLLGFAGILVVLRPGTAVFDPWMLTAVGAAAGFAGIALLLKAMSAREPPMTLVGLNLIITVPLALALTLPVWITPGPALLAFMAAQGALGALAQVAVTRAMAKADVSFLTPIEFVRLPLVVLLGYLLFAEAPDLWTLFGSLLIFAAVFWLVRRPAVRAPVAGSRAEG
jgi:drug/metabolite transporter (DMT)-like permease